MNRLEKHRQSNCHTNMVGALRQLARTRGSILDLQASYELAEELLHGHKESGLYPVSCIEDASVVAPWLWGATIQVNTDNLKTLTPLRRTLRQLGFDAPEVHDAPEQRARYWTYSKFLTEEQRTGRPELKITLRGQLPWGENEGCQYVQTGVEEKPVYELQCGDLNGEEHEETADV